ncbi:MAG: nucleotidyltransferase domain-containing protein [Thermoanaerobaculia bacterium]
MGRLESARYRVPQNRGVRQEGSTTALLEPCFHLGPWPPIVWRSVQFAHTFIEELPLLIRDWEFVRSYGVRHLALFGSAARGEDGAESGLDFLVEFDRKTFRSTMGLLRLLEGTFGRHVDLVIREALKPALRESVLRAAVDVPGF